MLRFWHSSGECRLREPDELGVVNDVAVVEAVLAGDQALLESRLSGEPDEFVLGEVCRYSIA